MSRTYRRSRKSQEPVMFGWRRGVTDTIIKEQEGRGIPMGCPDGKSCSWCNYKNDKYYDNVSGVNDWK